jgi:hypothetical protein
MADIGIVPSFFSNEGNVLAAVERLDGAAFPDDPNITPVESLGITLGPTLRGRIYFTPPPSGDDTFSKGLLSVIGANLVLETPASFVDGQLACVQSLRKQMSVLRELVETQVAVDREGGLAEEVVRERYVVALSDADLRLVGALEKIDQSAQPSADPGAVATELNALEQEHRSELERFQTSTFPPNAVAPREMTTSKKVLYGKPSN